MREMVRRNAVALAVGGGALLGFFAGALVGVEAYWVVQALGGAVVGAVTGSWLARRRPGGGGPPVAF